MAWIYPDVMIVMTEITMLMLQNQMINLSWFVWNRLNEYLLFTTLAMNTKEKQTIVFFIAKPKQYLWEYFMLQKEAIIVSDIYIKSKVNRQIVI